MDDPESQRDTHNRIKSGQHTLLPEKPHRIRKKSKTSNPYHGYLKLCFCGLSLMGIAYMVHFIDPVSVIKNTMLGMEDGSYIYKIWKAPPIKLYIKIYIFNITNAVDFMKGRDAKIKVSEVGPYTYSETLVNTDIKWNPNRTISFTPKRKVIFEPGMSIGDPYKDMITVPNGITSMLYNSSAGLNLALSTIVSYLDSQPLLDVTVDNFLWGYDDPLVKLARNILPSWINFEKFGLLDRMMDEGINRITMKLEKTNATSAFSIQNFNGSPGLKHWGYTESNKTRTSNCDIIDGAVEGVLFPKNISPKYSFSLYRKAFCRTLPFVFDKEVKTPAGYPAYLYKFPDSILDPENEQNKCYCIHNAKCLPPGLSDLSPCYYGIPVAISLPHFVHEDEKLGAAVEGLAPSQERHGSVFAVQPDVGVPLHVKTRIQLNLVVKKTKFVPRTKAFNNMVLPIFWMEVELDSLPDSVLLLMNLLLVVGPAIQTGAIVALFCIGLGIIFVANLRYAWKSGVFRRSGTATMISYRQKQKAEPHRVVWKANYTQILAEMPSIRTR